MNNVAKEFEEYEASKEAVYRAEQAMLDATNEGDESKALVAQKEFYRCFAAAKELLYRLCK